jgi:Uma2 family endonuclease
MSRSSAVAVQHLPASPVRSARIDKLQPEIPPLENGAHLDADEFMRRYEAMPEIKKAELINGIVYIMSSPVSTGFHGEPDLLMHMWLGHYAMGTPGVKAATNSTLKLGIRNVPQPDSFMRLLPERGGKTVLDEKKYLKGPPELVIEIAASSTSMDVHQKLDAYRRAGVAEYIVWRTYDAALDWWFLKDDKYVPIKAGKDGILRSRVFPGLWLNAAALLKDDSTGVMDVLQRGLKSPEHARFVK